MTIEDRWLSVEDICKYLGVSNDTVYKWIDTYNMPAHRMGRLWKFKKDEVDEWVKAGGANQAKQDAQMITEYHPKNFAYELMEKKGILNEII